TGDFTGWSQFGCQVTTFHHSGMFGASLGTNACGFTCGGTLKQTNTAVAGHSYPVDFWLANENLESFGNSIVVSFAGVTILSLVDSPDFSYTHFSGTVTATSTSSLLQFSSSHIRPSHPSTL